MENLENIQSEVAEIRDLRAAIETFRLQAGHLESHYNADSDSIVLA